MSNVVIGGKTIETAAPVDGTAGLPITNANPLAVNVVSGSSSSTITGPLGRRSDATSVSVALSTEDVAALTPVGGFKSTVALTRTNDTNAYLAGDVIGSAVGSTAAIAFAIGAAGGGNSILTSIDLRIDLAAVISGMTSYRLYLYSATPPSALGDNAPWDLPSGDRSVFIGYVDFGTPVDLGSTLFVQTDGVNKQVAVPAGGVIYGYLVTNGAFTPSASIVFNPTLRSIGI